MVVVGLVLVVVPRKICSYALTKYARLLLKQRHNDRLRLYTRSHDYKARIH